MKQNSLATTNELSTEIGDTMKSYSSKYKHFKMLHKNKLENILPVRLQRAAVTIQKYWRKRAVFKKLTYEQIETQLDKQNQLLQFENRALGKIIDVYQQDCRVREQLLEELAKEEIEQVHRQSSEVIKKLVVATLQMQRQHIEEDSYKLLTRQREECKKVVAGLKEERRNLQMKVGQESQESECRWMGQLKEVNLQLLIISKSRSQLQRQLKQKVVERCRNLMQV